MNLMDGCSDCAYNVENYCIMFDDVLGYENCVFRGEEEDDGA